MSELREDRWHRLWRAIGATGDAATWFHSLSRAYAEPHRHYHNQRHIAECLAEFDAARDLAKQPEVVEMALWFHDAVYDPKAADNEEQSAALAKECLRSAGRTDLAEPVAALVMTTKFHETERVVDAPLMVDVDLSILGQREDRFAEYEASIRAEYSWVPRHIFNSKRAEILLRFLSREHIFVTEPFCRRFERQARINLENSVQQLTNDGTGES